MGLRESSVRQFLKKNFDFIAGVFSELGLAAVFMAIALAVCVLLVIIKSII